MINKDKTKTRIFFTNFGRLEKIIFYNLCLDNNFEVVGIATNDRLKNLAYFLQLDSNHAKFMLNKITFQETKTSKKLIIDKNKKINIFDPSKLTTTQLKALEIDIIVDCSQTIKFSKLSSYTKVSKWTVGNFRNDFKKNQEFQMIAFDYNHEQIDVKKNNLILLPSIENVIVATLTKIFHEKFKILGGFYNIIKGPSNTNNILDLPNENKDNLTNSRSIFNNIIHLNNEEQQKEMSKLMELKKLNISFESNKYIIPVTTGSLININWIIKNFFKVKEINDLIVNNVNAQIGFSENELVSQDVVSTNHYCIVDKNMTKILNSKGDQIISIGAWFDYESSQAINYFRILQLLSVINN